MSRIDPETRELFRKETDEEWECHHNFGENDHLDMCEWCSMPNKYIDGWAEGKASVDEGELRRELDALNETLDRLDALVGKGYSLDEALAIAYEVSVETLIVGSKR